MELKEKIIVMSMPISFDKCVKLDRNEEVMNRAIPLPEPLIPLVRKALSDVLMDSSNFMNKTVGSLKVIFIKNSLDNIFYDTDDRIGSYEELRSSRDGFIDSIDGMEYVMNKIWDNMYELTDKVLESSGAYEKAKYYFKISGKL